MEPGIAVRLSDFSEEVDFVPTVVPDSGEGPTTNTMGKVENPQGLASRLISGGVFA